jgi:hypothetical protein
MRGLESSIERFVCSHARSRGCVVLKLNPEFNAGIPDRLFLLPRGKTVIMEFKRKGGKLTKLQEARHAELARLGHHVYVVYDPDEAIRILDAEMR